jgi:nitrate reductase alpha subunit
VFIQVYSWLNIFTPSTPLAGFFIRSRHGRFIKDFLYDRFAGFSPAPAASQVMATHGAAVVS